MLFAQLTFKEIEKLPKDTLFSISISPMEAHGPHLPVSTDFEISKKIEGEAIKILRAKGIECYSLPSLPIGVCKYLESFAGTISIPWKALYKVTLGILKSLAKHGFQYLVISTFHMDLWHLKAIHKAMRKAKKYGMVACEPLSYLYFSKEIYMDGEIHADIKETSLALYLFPEMVKDYRIKDYKMKMGLIDYFKKFKSIAKNGYIGSPSKANIEFGEKLFGRCVNFFVESAINLKKGITIELPLEIKALLRI